MYRKSILILYLIIISIYDSYTGRIPNFITATFFLSMFLYDVFTGVSKIPNHLFFGLFFFLLFLGISLFTKGLGVGDVKLAAVIGYCEGFFNTSLIFIIACIAGLLYFLIRIFLKKNIKKIPLAPFVTVGYFMSEIFCRRIL